MHLSSNNTKNKSSFYYDLKDFNHDHDHLIINFTKNIKIIYNDIRKFGFIKIIKTPKIFFSPHLKDLGPEPFSKKFNLDYFKSKIKKRKIILKDLLMSQKFLSGLGNIYVNEVIFLSKLNPRIKVKKLLNKNILSLIKNIRKVLRKAIKQGGSSVKNFNNTKGQKENSRNFYVFMEERENLVFVQNALEKSKLLEYRLGPLFTVVFVKNNKLTPIYWGYIQTIIMPNTKSAIRRVRRVKKQTSINKIRKSKYKSAVKHMENLIHKGDKKKIKEYFSKFQSILTQVAKTGIVNKKTASRKISKISKKIS